MEERQQPPKPIGNPDPFRHLTVTPAEAERMKAEFAAKMKAIAKDWPGRRRKKSRARR
jgi:hypothetical protein